MTPPSFEDLIKDIDTLEIGELKKRIINLASAYRITQELASANELEKLVGVLMERVTSALRVEIGSLMLVDKMQNELRIKAAKGLKKEIIEQTRVKLGEGIAGWVAKETKPLLIDDLSKHPQFTKRGGKYSTDSLLTVPLVVGKELVGVLNVNNKATKEIFNKDDLDTLVTIANQAALLIKNSQEYEEMKKLNQVKSDFVSVVSHELRTPLATVKEGLSLLLDGVAGKITGKQKEIISLSKQNIDRLSRLIGDMLDLSKMEAGRMKMKREFIDIAQLINKSVESFKPSADKGQICLTAHLAEDIGGIWADSDRITEVLYNLIGNAIKFTQKGGKVDVILKRRDKDIEIVVKDTGKGVKPEDKEKMFEKFSQVSFKDGKIDSTGLGLSITKEIVELHKGSIGVESEPGKGTEFVVNLPMDLRTRR
jgi:signal transduction histidine kinase